MAQRQCPERVWRVLAGQGVAIYITAEDDAIGCTTT